MPTLGGFIHLDAGGVDRKLAIKTLQIGDWDMDANATVSVTHGVTLAKIRAVFCTVRDDADTPYYTIGGFNNNSSVAEVAAIDATTITLQRRGTNFFDSTNYNATTFNRGWVTIIYAL